MVRASSVWLWAICCAALVLFRGCTGSHLGSNNVTIRVMTYNIHHGEGADSVFDFVRIANDINQSNADIVALQDVDRWVERTHKIDLMTKLADFTGMTYTFGKSTDLEGGEHGNGLLTRFPILEEKYLTYRLQLANDPCSLMRVVLDVRGTEIVVMNTELSGDVSDTVQNSDVEEILATAKEYHNVPILVCGCLNCAPGNTSIAAFASDFEDSWTLAGSGKGYTFPSTDPVKRADYVFVSKSQVPTDSKSIEVSLKPVRANVVDSNASNHLPLLVALKVVSD